MDGVLPCAAPGLMKSKVSFSSEFSLLRGAQIGRCQRVLFAGPPKQVWKRFVRGSTVLVVKPAGKEEEGLLQGHALFRIDHDHGGYLK
jgi:hypothetical protein